ncbi:bifunctional DNA primase/polymerase [Nocardia gipuzkoensis]
MENEAIVPQTTCGSAVSRLCVHVATQALYYRAPRTPPLRDTIARLGWRIDSRGHGGYVVAAGSQLPEGPYRRLDDRAPIPRWLTDLLSPPAPLPVPRSAPVVGHPDAYMQAALVHQSTRVRAAYAGVRHRTLLLAANSLGRLVGAGLLDHDHAHAVLGDAARIHVGFEGFTATEADRTITDGLTYAATRTSRWSLTRGGCPGRSSTITDRLGKCWSGCGVTV